MFLQSTLAILMRAWTKFARFMQTAENLDVRLQVRRESLDCLKSLSLFVPKILLSPSQLKSVQGRVIIYDFIVVSRVSLRIRLVCHLMHVSHTLMRCLLLLLVHLLPLTAARRVAPFSAIVGLGMHEDGSSVHDACSNSWSDTGRVEGPTGRRCTKVGVSGPAEDLRPVSEVEAGVNFRPAGGVRGQIAGSLLRRQRGTGTRRVREGAVTPSLHPEVPGIQFVSPGYGLDIRQSMGRRCVVPHVRGFGCQRVTPELVCYLPIKTTFGWDGGSRVHTRLPGLRQGTTVCVHMRMDMEQLSDRKLMTPSGMVLLVCGEGSRPSCRLGVAGGNCQRV